MKFLYAFLFVFIFSIIVSPLALVSGEMKTDKLKLGEYLKEKDSPEKEIKLEKWQVAIATYYDPMDESQTKPNPDGVGASGRIVSSGSIATSLFDREFIKDSIVYIEIKDCHIVTPYGKGVFRVDDLVSSDDDMTKIDFFYKDLNSKQKRLGKFHVVFRIKNEADV